MPVDREVIEHALDSAVKDFMANLGHKEIIPGWRALFLLGFQVQEVGQASIPTMQSEQVEHLLAMSETWPDAFDAASYLAGIGIAVGLPISPLLRTFAAKVLLGELKRPAQIGRPLSKGKFRAMWQYALAHLVHERAEIPMGRNRENSGSSEFNACEAVAAAFTRAGQRTTFEQIASVVYDSAHSDIRETARALKLLDFSRLDDVQAVKN